MRLIAQTARMDIMLDTDRKEILVVQKWKYNWRSNIRDSKDIWGVQIQRDFIDKVRKLIKNIWCSKAYCTIKSRGIKSDWVEYCTGIIFNIRIEIRQVTCNEHWRIDVQRAWRNTPENMYVNWKRRYIHLDSNSIQSRILYFPDDSRFKHLSVGERKMEQPIIAHEFGHAFGNVTCIAGMSADEYEEGELYYNDIDSIMNVGSRVRIRHFNYLKMLLGRMQPNALFEIELY